MNNYTTEQARNVLRVVVDEQYHSIFLEKHTNETMLDALCKKAFPSKDFQIYHNQLQTMKITSFSSFSEFDSEFRRNVEFANSCLDKSEELTTREIKLMFMNGLERKHRFSIMNQGLEDLESIRDFLKRFEEFANNEENTFNKSMNTKKLQRNSNSNNYNNGDYVNKRRDSNIYDNGDITAKAKSQNKWCSFHRSKFHNTDECMTLKNKKNKDDNETNNLIIREEDTKNIDVSITGKLEGTEVSILLDTGSKLSFISDKCLERTGKHPEIYETPVTIQTANGEIEKIEKSVEMNINIPQIPECNLPVRLHMLKKLPVDINVGTEFMSANNVVIDFNKGLVSIKGIILDITQNSLNPVNNEFEKLILDKVMIARNTKKSILQEINSYVSSNPTLGLIPNFEHKIHLKDNNPVSLKEYPLPIKLVEKTREELKRLKEQGVIRKSSSEYASPAFPILKKDGSLSLSWTTGD
jgi:hypothetical protein